MGLKARLTKDEHGKLADGVKTLYVERDGAFVLDVDEADGWALDNVTGLKSSLSAARKERDDAKKAAQAFEGLDAGDTKAKLKQLDDLLKADPEGKAKTQLEALKRQLEEKHASELKAAADKAANFRSELEVALIDNAIRTALAEQKLVDGGADLIFPHVRAQVKLVEETVDGKQKFVARVKNADGVGDRISSKQGNSGPMSVGELVETFRSQKGFDRLFVATSPKGGADGNNGGRPPGGNLPSGNTPQLNPVARLADAIRAEGSGN